MEKSKKAIEGEQPVIHQNNGGKEMNDSLKNDKPASNNEQAKRPQVSGKSNSSKTSSPARSRAKVSTSSKKEDNGSEKSVSSSTEEMNPKEIEFMEETDLLEDKTSTQENRKANAHSADNNWSEWDEVSNVPAESEGETDYLDDKSESGKDLDTLKRKAEKAEKKVAKLKKKFKKAKKKEAAGNKLKALKDKLIKANLKLKRRLKKLKNANE